MASPKRDTIAPGGGKLLKSDDTVFDLTSLLSDIDSGSLSASVVATSPDDVVDVVLSLDANAYADGDCLAATQQIANAMRSNGGTAVLKSVVVVDEDDNGEALDILILQTNVGIGNENDAADIGTNGDKVLAVIEVATTDYVDLVSAQIATPVLDQEFLLEAASGSTSLYLAAVCRASAGATYTDGGVTVRLGLIRN